MAKKKGFLNEIVSMDDPFVVFVDDINSSAGDVSFIDTGSYIFNAALSASIFGGIPDNSVTALAGAESVGKTYFAMGILNNFLSKHEDAGGIYFETEGAPKQVIKTRGIDPDRIRIIQPDTIQLFRTKALNYLESYEAREEKNRPPLMMLLDSLGGLSTIKELKDMASGDEARDMTRNQLIRGAFRVLTLKLEKLRVPMIVTNHVYADIMSYGAPKTMSGGGGLKYAASSIAFLSKTKLKDTDKDVIGNIIKVKMVKNRWAKENSEVETKLLYDKGLDRFYGLDDLCVKHKLFEKKKGGFIFPDGSSVTQKELEAEPEKYYTPDLLKTIDEIAKKEFAYGN